MSQPIHATCVAIDGRGVLLTGPPGAGKSDLAFRLIDRGAELVADDGVLLTAEDGRLIAACPATIAGRIELRSVGIISLPHRERVSVALCVALDGAPERLPPDPLPTRDWLGLAIPLLALAPFEASTPLKIEQALSCYGLRP